MKKLFVVLCAGTLFSCESAQRGDANYSDSSQEKSDTTTVPTVSSNSDSTRPDSTVKDSIYHK